jgi:Skp family chaperone for outer membrane proteins
MIQPFNRTGVAAAISLAIALLAPAAFAQSQSTPQQAPPQGNAAAPQTETGSAPNDTELKNFAGAAMDVQNIRQSLQPQLAAAKTADARTQLQQSGEKKMEAAVESHQLTPQRYVQIANLVQTDNSVRAKVQSFMPPQQPQQPQPQQPPTS